MTLTLYELTDAYKMLLEADEDAGAGSFEEALYQIGGEISAKAESIAKVIRSLEAEVEAINAEVKRLQAKRESRETRVLWLKDYLQRNMESAGLERITGTLFTVALQNSPPSCRVEDAAAVPDRYQVVVPATMRVNSQAIVEHWRETGGEQVPGATVAQGRHIRIR